jgi:hypothetical protein
VKYVNQDGSDIDPNVVETKIDVHHISRFDDQLLHITGRFVLYDTIGNEMHYSSILVRQSDGAIFDFAKIELSGESNSFINSSPFQKDANGLIYLASLNTTNLQTAYGANELLRMDITNIENPSYVNILPSGQWLQAFVVDNEGNAFYDNYGLDGTRDFKLIKKTGGILIPDKSISFPWKGTNGSLYSFIDDAIYKLEVNNDHLIKNLVWEGEYSGIGIGGGYRIEKAHAVAAISHNGIWEFNETTNFLKLVAAPEGLGPLNLNTIVQTGEHVFMYKGSALYKIRISDYLFTEIVSGKYEFYSIGAGSNNELMFSALRYSDGKKVLGKVTATNEILIIEEEGGREATYLIRID